MLGRETALDPFAWTPDGWPVLNQGKGPSDQNLLPLPPCPLEERPDWMTPRYPGKDQFLWKGDTLLLRGGCHDLSDIRCRSLLLRRQSHFRCCFSVQVHVPSGGEAGILCYYDERSFLAAGVKKEGDEWFLTEREQEGEESRHLLHQKIRLIAGESVSMLVQTDGLCRTIIWKLPDGSVESFTRKQVTWLCDEGLSLGKRFTGAMTGVYALNNTDASFSQITYRN